MNKLTVLMSAALVAGGAFAATYTYTGGDPNTAGYDNDWNAANMWQSGAVPTAGNDYVIDKTYSWVYFDIHNGSDEFKGGSLSITCPSVELNAEGRFIRLTVKNLTLGSGSTLATKTTASYSSYPHGLWLTGTPLIDGTLRVNHEVKSANKYFGGYLSGNLSGLGRVELRGDTISSTKIAGPNWRIDGDNSAFKGKFVFLITEAMSGGESFATGVEIKNANALGGARDSFTPDAVEIKSWNGLVTVDNDITLNAANSGILMQTNSFFEVPANRILTVAEPIRLTGGFFKKGAGTLALTGGFSFGADGNAVADGDNSALAVKEGVLRVTSASDLADLDVYMAAGTMLELVGTTTATFRSLRAAGVLTIEVDCTGLAAGSTQTITLNMPRSDAEALVGKVDVMAKGVYASIGSDLNLTETGATITLKVPPEMDWHTYIGTWDTDIYYWNDEKDRSASPKYLWDTNSAAVMTDGYIVNSAAHFNSDTTKFNGGALRVRSNTLTVVPNLGSVAVTNLTVDAGATFRVQSAWEHEGGPRFVHGGLWRIDGTLSVAPLAESGSLCLDVPLIGSGLVSWSGWNNGMSWDKSRNQRLESDNSRFRGKFKVNLHRTSEGAGKAAGVRIVDARALGGALSVMTPDALTLNANNGLIAGQTLTLDAENRGILMYTNAYFEVESGKTLTLKEPIRVVNGIMKKGNGTLALGGDVSVGSDGTTSPNGTNNKLTVQAGTIKAASTNGIAKLAFDFASGTKLELDAFPSDDGVRAGGFYFAGDTPFTAADAKIQLNIAFPDDYKIEEDVNVVLCTVKSANVETVMNSLSVTATGLARRGMRSFWTENAGNGLTRIGYQFQRGGFIISFK